MPHIYTIGTPVGSVPSRLGPSTLRAGLRPAHWHLNGPSCLAARWPCLAPGLTGADLRTGPRGAPTGVDPPTGPNHVRAAAQPRPRLGGVAPPQRPHSGLVARGWRPCPRRRCSVSSPPPAARPPRLPPTGARLLPRGAGATPALHPWQARQGSAEARRRLRVRV